MSSRKWLAQHLIKTGTRPVRHGRYAIFQMVEVDILRKVYAGILTMISVGRGPSAGETSA